MPPPEKAGWQGWALHWLARAALEQEVRPRDLARLAWRLRSTEAASLKLSAPWLRQAVVDADVSAEAVAEIDSLLRADVERRRKQIGELEVVAGHL